MSARRILPALAMVVAGLWAPAQPPGNDAAVRETQLLTRWSAALEALRPADPEAYLRLGEDVADAEHNAEGVALAMRLFALAFELDRARGVAGGPIAASACLALADLSPQDRDRRWLTALATAMDPKRKLPAWMDPREQDSEGHAGYIAATALGLVRSGDGVTARQMLEDAQVRRSLERHDRFLTENGEWGGLASLEVEAAKWPCRECANARVVKRSGPGGSTEFRLCPGCDGNPGPKLTPERLIVQLRLESWLLGASQRSWSAQAAADLGRPLRDPDPAEVIATFNVDANKPIFRDGQWVEAKPLPDASSTPAAGR